ncbi:MAG: hypothetical protein KJI71_02930 [Patescibacteria group bacterium]|nr:hypothetical protein [Patescibacteria group bacterium]
MINLLSKSQREELQSQENLRMVLILGVLFLSFILSLGLILLLVKNYFLLTLESKRILFREREKIVSLNKDLEKEISQYNVLLSDINSSYQEQYDLTQALERAYQTLPDGTYLTNFNFIIIEKKVSQGTKKTAKISMSGVCPTRELLLSFKESLESEKSFSGVYFSPNSWIEPIGPKFNVTFELN